jgi:hypothetical protein
MNKILKISLIVFLSFSVSIFAQLDTLNYLKQFEANKANYIGQPFSKLLNDISQVHPKTVWPVPNFKTKNYNFSTNFNFCDKEFSFYNVITLSVEWENPILRSETKYYQQLNDSFFTNDEKGFYGSKIVKDIKVYR